jgi:hypothetical protein
VTRPKTTSKTQRKAKPTRDSAVVVLDDSEIDEEVFKVEHGVLVARAVRQAKRPPASATKAAEAGQEAREENE